MIIDELGMAAIRTNYGQTPYGIHAFVVSVAMAGTVGGGLWSVKGGNKLIAERALEASGATLVQLAVTKIIYDSASETYA